MLRQKLLLLNACLPQFINGLSRVVGGGLRCIASGLVSLIDFCGEVLLCSVCGSFGGIRWLFAAGWQRLLCLFGYLVTTILFGGARHH